MYDECCFGGCLKMLNVDWAWVRVLICLLYCTLNHLERQAVLRLGRSGGMVKEGQQLQAGTVSNHVTNRQAHLYSEIS